MKKNRHELNARLNEREMLIVKYLISNVVCLKLKKNKKKKATLDIKTAHM